MLSLIIDICNQNKGCLRALFFKRRIKISEILLQDYKQKQPYKLWHRIEILLTHERNTAATVLKIYCNQLGT